ncbi:MAG: 3-phosphoshikimate 1-carboxyvinyltransferase [Acidobacteria bacterium RIFCSPLOWO2_02_FULL_61_28]|nr:MAG: 3-phosphoshikimate 1-carboxyvinyltransferase [Acidobacteria bacterium RIFCSPLOWO2_02_FULL_61_28]
MDRSVQPARRIAGGVRLPGDKSISHRYALLGAVAEGETSIRNYAPGADCASTLHCLEHLGVATARRKVDSETGEPAEKIVITGRGLCGFLPAKDALDAGNSGSTIRMLSGLLAGHLFRSVITGDQSLQRRPMKRVIEPLTRMGATIRAREGNLPPLEIHGTRLRGIDYPLPVASAQVKSAVLLAGLLAEGQTTVTEPVQTRDHTEIALAHFGAEIERKRRITTVHGGTPLKGQKLTVPGDLSSAAFFLCAALLFPDSDLYLQDVGLNPTRTALLDFLSSMGAQIKVLNLGESSGELIGDLHVIGGRLRGGQIDGEMVAALIDEIPVLAVLGTQTEDGLIVRGAEELRLKESDRIATVAENLKRMGAKVEVFPDGFAISGRQSLSGAELDSFGDHRIVMAFAVAALVAKGESRLHNSEAATVSFPGFFEQLERIAER